MKRSEETIEVQEPRVFALYSSSEVGIFPTPYQLLVGLSRRKDFFCELIAHNNIAELNFIVQQYYPSYFLQNNSFPHVPLQLPQNTSFYAVQYTEALPIHQGSSNYVPSCTQPNLTTFNFDCGYWGINALNGFCVLNSVNLMIAWMADLSALVAPWAKSFTDIQTAYTWARNEYSNRFYKRYESRNELIDLPGAFDPNNLIFIDQYFGEREKRWKEQDSLSRFVNLYQAGFLW